MTTKDGFQPDRSPIFLSEPAEEIGQADIGKALDRAVISSRILKASIWAAEEQTRAQAKPAQPVQAAPVKVVQDAPAQVRPMKKHRRVRSVQNARAEIRPQRHHRARVREEQDAREQVAPVADPRAPDPSVQN